MISSTRPLTPDLLQAQLGDAYYRYTAAERFRHLELLQAVRRLEDVALHAERKSDDRWTVTICTSDCLGVLSVIAGLFTAYHFDILSADVFTLHLAQRRAPGRPRGAAPRVALAELKAPSRKILDIFEVRALGDAQDEVWQRFRAELAALVVLLVAGQREQAQGQIIDRVSDAFRTAGHSDTKLFPVSIAVSNEDTSPHTRLTVRSPDLLGFLFAFTNALAGLTVNIERAEIRTVGGEASDTFWVTGSGGQKIVQEQRIHELRVATALIKQFTHLLPRSPNPGQALRQFHGLVYQMLSHPEWVAELHNLESTVVLETLAELMGVSRFLWEDFLRMQHENLFPVLLDIPALDQPWPKERLRAALQGHLHDVAAASEQIQELNNFKDREMFRIDLRHITGRIGFQDFSAELSALAEVVIEGAAQLAVEMLQQRFGPPTLADGGPCPWCICGLGKLGGAELGFGSDVELLFVYAGEGTTAGPSRVPNSQYFGEFVRTFLGTLQVRQEGVFEIDLRLRPYGSAGALASALEGFLAYYAAEGPARQFERMALVKLRPVAGDLELASRILHARDAFVYSGKPLDLENIQHLRHRQAVELVPPGMVNAKYSPGGLADIEYFVQAWQIAVGLRDPTARVTNTLYALDRLVAGGHLRAAQAEGVRQSYRFLRRLIDALRVVRGHAKDLTLPPWDSREFAYLAHRLQYASVGELEHAIATQMACARALWDGSDLPRPESRLIPIPETEQGERIGNEGAMRGPFP